MLRGELPSRAQAALLEAALVASVDHGPQAPSIAIARMAVTCGARINGAMASAINVLDDVHGGPGQQCMELYFEIDAELGAAGDLGEATRARAAAPSRCRREVRARLRAPLASARPSHPAAALARRRGDRRGSGGGRFAAIGRAVEDAISEGKPEAHPHEHRRRDGGDLLRARPHARTRARRLHPVALGRHPRPRQRADAAGRPHQGPRAEVDRLHVHRTGTPIRPDRTRQ